MTSAAPLAPIVEAFRAFQSAAAELRKHAENGGFALVNDSEEFLDLAREIEAERRALDTLDYPIVAEVETRGLAAEFSARNTATLLSLLWRVTPHEANGRVREAAALGPQVSLSGQPLAALRPVAARARALGILSGTQTTVILKTLDALPRSLPVEQVDAAERTLVAAAHALNPLDLRNVGLRLLDTIDPDGPEPVEDHQHKRRDLSFRDEYDGMIRLSALLDPLTAAKAQALIQGLAAPRPEDGTGRDDRTPGQRRHDALSQLLDLGLRAEHHAADAATPVMVHVSMSAEQFETGTGHAATTYGQRIRVAQALRLADQACVGGVVHNSTGGILNYGRSRRLASRRQTEALTARDGGCASPGCRIPPEWCERHHIIEWQHGGRTDLDNLVLLCAYHHRRLQDQGWTITIHDHVPWFTPPPHIDPERKPLRNIRALIV